MSSTHFDALSVHPLNLSERQLNLSENVYTGIIFYILDHLPQTLPETVLAYIYILGVVS